MSSSNDDGEWISATRRSPRQRQASSRTQDSASISNDRQNCPQCHKECLVNKDGTLRRHPCNQNPFESLTIPEETNDNTVDLPLPSRSEIPPPAPASTRQTQPRNRTTTQPSTQETIRSMVDTYQGKKTGPKFRTANVWAATFESHLQKLHNEVNGTNDTDCITDILVELLSCTPPNSRIHASIDNTLTMNDDDYLLSQLINDQNTLLPSHIQDRPKIAVSIIAAIKSDLNFGNISKATRKLSPGGIQSLKDKTVRDTIRSKYSLSRSITPNELQENRNTIFDEDMINFSDEATQIATIKHIFKKTWNIKICIWLLQWPYSRSTISLP